MNNIRVLHNTPGVGQRAFGVGMVALNLTREQNFLGCTAQIWCHDNVDEVRWASESSGLQERFISRFPLWGPKMFWLSPQMERAASSVRGQAFDIVHQHGLWPTGASRTTNLLRKKHEILSVIAPHGSLNSWALNNRSRWKKKIALAAYESENLHSAACLHATSETEVADFRDFGLKNPIAVICNGISDTWLNTTGDGERFRNQFDIPADCRILFFLSRITPKKGLPMLIEAIQSLKDDFSEWLLVIAGTDEFGHKAEVEALTDRFQLQDRVFIIGPLYDQSKSDAFAAADLFILPSYSEGSPMVILDCLATGVPIITTKASPWEELNTRGCGWWVDIGVDAIASALRQAICLTSEQLADMGQRGKNLVASKYAWPILAKKTVELYEWMLHMGDKPDFVELH